MLFDDFVQSNRLSVTSVDRFDGHTVTVTMPPDWEAIESPPDSQVWIWQADPLRGRFCANLVLTQSRIDAALDPAGVFAMLCDSTARIFTGIHEYTREVEEAAEGPGILGRFGMLINAESGVLASESLTRVISENHTTLIAQLTLTCLADSPVDRPYIRLAVTPAGVPDITALVDYHGSTPQTAQTPKSGADG